MAIRSCVKLNSKVLLVVRGLFVITWWWATDWYPISSLCNCWVVSCRFMVCISRCRSICCCALALFRYLLLVKFVVLVGVIVF